MFQSVKKIGFSTLALLAIVLMSFRPVFAETTGTFLTYGSIGTHEHAKFRAHADLSTVLTEADSEETDDADEEASLHHIHFLISAEVFAVPGFSFVPGIANPRLSGPVSVDVKSNASAIYLRHRQILR